MMLAAVPLHAEGAPTAAMAQAAGPQRVDAPRTDGSALPSAQSDPTETGAAQPAPTPQPEPTPQPGPVDPSAPEPTASPAPLPASPPPAPVSDGEVVVTARSRAGDPLQDVNVASFNAAQGVDKAVFGPAAKAYRKGIPKPLRSGLRNFLNNLREPVVFLNYLLQLKPGKAAETAGRFAVNSTVGLAGLIDVAKKKPFHLPRRRNGFANTLGYYGVKPGPFFFAPLLGPTTLRDLIGNIADQAVPVGPIRPFQGQAYSIPVAVLSALDYRAEFDDELERQRATADPYAAARRYYLERRQAEIDRLRGRKRTVERTPPPTPVPPVPLADHLADHDVSDSAADPVAVGRVAGPPA